MHRLLRIPVLALFLLLSLLAAGAAAGPEAGPGWEPGTEAGDGRPDAVRGLRTTAGDGPRILVRLEPGAPPVGEAVDLVEMGLERAGSISGLQTEILSLAGDSRPERMDALLEALQGNPHVRTAEADVTRTVQRTPDDPQYGLQWALPAAGFPEAWDTVTGGADVVIAVLDTGIARDVPDIQGRIVDPYSVQYGEEWPAWEDIVGHGTQVATIAAAQGDNGIGMAGAAWGLDIMPVHLSDSESFPVSAELQGLMWAMDHGADIVNISAGSLESSALEQEAMQQVREAGVLVVAAAGNGGEEALVQYPAAYPEVLAVGATDFDDERAGFSSGGEELDMVAPGVALVCYSADDVSYFLDQGSGTSFAAPLVSGAAGLLLSVDPTLSPGELSTILTSTATDLGTEGWDGDFGWGLLDAAEAVASLESPGETTTTTESASTTTSTESPATTSTTTTTTTTTTTVPPTTTTTASTTTSTTTISTTTTTTAPSTTTTTIPRTFFSDVEPSHPYYDAIVASARAGVVSGYGDGRFRPDEALTRQQFAKMIMKTLQAPVSEEDVCQFGDVQVSGSGLLYPDNYVAAAARWGITRGIGGESLRFNPHGLITRAQVVTMVVRGVDHLRVGSLEDPPTEYTPSFGRFSPVHDSAAARAEYNGLLDDLVGIDSGSEMWDQVTRGEVAAVLAPLLDQ